MDQSAAAKMFEAMFETLVDQVTAAVTAKLDALIGARFANARAELEETVAARIAVDEDALDDRIERWMENNLDVEHEVASYMTHHFDLDDLDISTRIQDFIDEIDWKEKVSAGGGLLSSSSGHSASSAVRGAPQAIHFSSVSCSISSL